MTTTAFTPKLGNQIFEWQGGSPFQSEHVAYFYQESGSLLDALCDFVGPALASGNAAVIFATEEHREELEKRLTVRGLDIAKAARQGRYIALDAHEHLSNIMVDGMPDPLRFEEVVGGVIGKATAQVMGARPHVAAFGEMVSLLWSQGNAEAAIQLELLWNELSKRHNFSLRCAYPVSNFTTGEHANLLMRVCAQHSAVLLEENGIPLALGESKLAVRRNEERFRLLVDAVQDYAIFMLDVHGRISSWNTGAQRLNGYSVLEILGRHFSVFYTEEDLRSGKPERELEIAAREGRFEEEGWRLRKDGSRFWASVIITAIKDDAGKLTGFGKVTRDFTDRIRVDEALRKEIAERTEAQQKLHESEKSLRQLSVRLLQTQDEERRRIGRDLHDSVGQYLVGLKMKVDSLKSSVGQTQEGMADELAECCELAEAAIKEVRTISYLLYPPMLEELGLKSAIPWYLEGFTKRSGIQINLEVSPQFDRIPGDLELALFRVLQESLTNVHRHSGSATADIRLLTRDRTVVLQIIDHGKGTQSKKCEDVSRELVDAYGVGLRGMDERIRQLGGNLEVALSESGTTVTATVPLG
ncbi:MAG: PAS domain S-box protein [Nitrososphaerales archaeon]